MTGPGERELNRLLRRADLRCMSHDKPANDRGGQARHVGGREEPGIVRLRPASLLQVLQRELHGGFHFWRIDGGHNDRRTLFTASVS